MSRRLIITADDYGMCETVNQAIEECLAAGALKASCVMTNMPVCGGTSYLRERFPHNSLGIHWTLTEGLPVLSPSLIPSLVRNDGSFHPALELRRRWLCRRIKRTEVETELRAQYQRFFALAGEPDFWNTHENFHVLPGLVQVCVSLGGELRIPAMRCHRRFTVPYNQSSACYHLRRPLYGVKRLVINRWSRRVRSQGMRMPDGMIHMPNYGTDLVSLEEVVTRLPWSSVKKALEMVIHPATTSQEEMFRVDAERRVLEYQMFRDPKLVKFLSKIGIETVGFEAL